MAGPPAAVRLSEVAAAAGVSIATASRSLRGLGGVSDTVAEKVRGIAEDLGYVTNSYARTLAGGSTTIVGLILNQIDDPYFTEIAAGVVRDLDPRVLTFSILGLCNSVAQWYEPEGKLSAAEVRDIFTSFAADGWRENGPGA